MSIFSEALEKIDHTVCLNSDHIKWAVDKYESCDCQSFEDFVDSYDTVEKAVNAFDIIRTKEVDIKLLNDVETFEEYNYYTEPELTKEEFEFLKIAVIFGERC